MMAGPAAHRRTTPGALGQLRLVRDRGVRAAAWCRIHHPHAWSLGGHTDMDNALPLCGHTAVRTTNGPTSSSSTAAKHACAE